MRGMKQSLSSRGRKGVPASRSASVAVYFSSQASFLHAILVARVWTIAGFNQEIVSSAQVRKGRKKLWYHRPGPVDGEWHGVPRIALNPES